MKKNIIHSAILILMLISHAMSAQNKHIIYVNSTSNFGSFNSGEVYAKVGDTIVWLPGDKPIIFHTITTNKFPQGAEPINFQFQLPSDTIFKYVVKFPGQFNYVCTPHAPYMNGNIWVTEPNGTMPKNIKYQYTDNTPQLAPNPAFNSVTFYQLDESIKYTLKVYNDLGKLVKETSITEAKEFEMNISNFNDGTYIAHLAYCACKPQKNACKGAGKTLKFVKQ